MAASQDTEITLGTGKMLLLFFGLVAICAVFFGVGFSLGKNSSRSMVSTDSSMANAPVTPIARPSGGKPTGSASSTSVADEYKPVDAKGSDAEVKAATKDANEGEAKQTSPSDSVAPTNAPAVTGGYFVQVAAVTKADDADALVAALKKKQYAAFVAPTSSNDKFYRVQVGPFSDVKEAETTRSKLVSDGYSPILKK
jgi:cell division septation protein DedD